MYRNHLLRNFYFYDREEQPEISHPSADEGADIAHLVRRCGQLDANSTYAYLLLCTHFAKTCVVARKDGDVIGFVSAYLKPDADDTLFIWQVVVAPDARRNGLANDMLRDLLRRSHLRNIRFIEATIGPTNEASRNLFIGFSREIDSPCEIKAGFSKSLFKREHHEDEYLLRIGPINYKESSDEPGYFQTYGIRGAVLRSHVPNGVREG